MDAVSLRNAIETTPAEVDAALRDAGLGPDLVALRAAFGVSPDAFPDRLLEWINSHPKRLAFETAVNARRPDLARRKRNRKTEGIPRQKRSWKPRDMARFSTRDVTARCRIIVGDRIVGSGCLVGPSLVLTAAHVLTYGAAAEFTNVEVMLHDGERQSVKAVPALFSRVSEIDLQDARPKKPYGFGDDNDIALLRLFRPVSSRYHNVSIPKSAWTGAREAVVFLLHYPEGRDDGVEPGELTSIDDPAERWGHSARTQSGSSGGAFFNTDFELIGIHQGRWPNYPRMVPLCRIIEGLREPVSQDLVPKPVWSLTGNIDGELIVARRGLFEAFQVMIDPASRVRGLRVRRLRPEGAETGLAFTAKILQVLVDRNKAGHRLMSYEWPAAVDPTLDFLADLARRLTIAGYLAADFDPGGIGGARPGETATAGASLARAQKLAGAVHAAAESAGKITWLLVNNTSALTDTTREALEALAQALLAWPRLRFVMVGFETIATPGSEFDLNAIGELLKPGGVGYVTEWFGDFHRDDIKETLRAALEAAGRQPSEDVLNTAATFILSGIPASVGVYSVAHLPAVVGRIREAVKAGVG